VACEPCRGAALAAHVGSGSQSAVAAVFALHNPHLYQRDVENIVNAILGEIVAVLAREDRVELPGFGTFSVKNRRVRGAQPENPKALIKNPCAFLDPATFACRFAPRRTAERRGQASVNYDGRRVPWWKRNARPNDFIVNALVSRIANT
jgi:nucleoid DNA-binding protein